LNKMVSLQSKSSSTLQNFNLNKKWSVSGIVQENVQKIA